MATRAESMVMDCTYIPYYFLSLPGRIGHSLEHAMSHNSLQAISLCNMNSPLLSALPTLTTSSCFLGVYHLPPSLTSVVQGFTHHVGAFSPYNLLDEYN